MFAIEQQIKTEYIPVKKGDRLVLEFGKEKYLITVIEPVDGKTIIGSLDSGNRVELYVNGEYNGRILGWDMKYVDDIIPVSKVRRLSGELLFINSETFVSYTAMPILSEIKVGSVIDLLFTKKTARLVQMTDYGMLFELSNGHIGVLDVADPDTIYFPSINRRYTPVISLIKVDA